MADLLDIVPATAVEVVRVNGERYKVQGISLEGIATLVSRFPDLRALATGQEGDLIARLIAGCGKAAGPIIAAGCGYLGDEEREQRAATLLPEYQLRLLRAIFELTFPNGLGSFVTELTALMGGGIDERAKVRTVRFKQLPSTSSPLPDMPDSLPNLQ